MSEHIAEQIRRAAAFARGGHHFEAAGEVAAQLSAEDTALAARLHIADLLRASYQRERRNSERVYDGVMRDRQATDQQRLEATNRFCRESFYCSIAKAWVSYGEATAEQHEARASFYAARIKGDTAARDRHLDAARRIREADASCLNDLSRELVSA